MIYALSLKLVGIVTGLSLLLLHTPAVVQKDRVRAWLQRFPRSKAWGNGLLLVATLWILVLSIRMDLGEFARLRPAMVGFVILAAILSWRFLDEFLSVRSLGVLALLVANPILDACFLQPPIWRLFLVVLAYIWIVLGLFWVGMPYLLRDQITWITASERRWNIAASAGLLAGLVILVCSLFYAPPGSS